MISDFVECIAVDIYDNIWFGTSVGVQMYDGVNWTSYASADFGLSTDNIKVLKATISGDVYIGTDFGASKFDGSNLEKIRNFLSNNGINSEVENLTNTYFQSSYESLLKLGFNQDSEVYRFFKIIQGRHF